MSASLHTTQTASTPFCMGRIAPGAQAGQMPRMAIGDALRRARMSRGITLERAADVIDSDAGNLSRKERGLQPWTDSEIQQLADHYGVRVSALYLEEEEQSQGGQRKSRRKALWDALFYTLEHRGTLDDAFRLLSPNPRSKRVK